jgi:hypothetical protein
MSDNPNTPVRWQGCPCQALIRIETRQLWAGRWIGTEKCAFHYLSARES